MAALSGISLLQISDLHILPEFGRTLLGIDTERYFHETLAHAFRQGIAFDLILVTGDLAQDPCPSSYTRILEKLNESGVPVICLAGNHDDYPLMQQIFTGGQVSCAKHLLLKNWQIICLNSQVENSPGGELAAEELDFLKDRLSAYPEYYSLITVHHHVLPSGSAWLDTMIVKNHAALFELLKDFPNARVITHGHIHQQSDKLFQNIRVLATPSTCFQFKPGSEHFALEQTAPGYRIIHLYEDGSCASEVFRLPHSLTQLELVDSGY